MPHNFDPNQFVEGESYPAQIIGAKITEAETGTVGIYLQAETANGNIDGTLWVTPRTRERLIKTFEDLGLDPAILSKDEFWDRPETAVAGVECSIVPEINEYEGEQSWRVRWWNGRRKVASSDARSKAAGLFKSAAINGSAAAVPKFNDDPPF